MREFYRTLDQSMKNEPLNESGILQGNANMKFILSLAEHGKPVPVTDMDKPAVYWVYEKTGKVYRLEDGSPDYAATVIVADNKVTINPHIAMVNMDGPVLMVLESKDLFTYSLRYIVDKNPAYTPQVLDVAHVDDYARKDLSNVPGDVFKAKGVAAGFASSDPAEFEKQLKTANVARNDLADVDLQKLYDKGLDAKLGAADMSNVLPATFDRELKANAAFLAMEKAGQVPGLTAAEIKKLFFANRYETQAPVDLTQPPYSDATTVIVAYQITSEGQTIKQTLAPHDRRQIVMVELLYSSGITTGSVEIDVADGEHLDGDHSQGNHVTFTQDGYAGYFMPLQNEPGYEFISHHEVEAHALSMSDERGNAIMGVTQMQFMEPLYLESEDGKAKINIDPSADGGIMATDGILGTDFKATKLQSSDKSVRIAQIASGVADMSVDLPHIAEGVFAKLSNPQPLNTNFHDQRLYFSEKWAHTGAYLGEDLTDKGWTIQDGSDDDPNITGGTAIRLGMWFVPTNNSVASDDGYVELKVIDLDTNDYLLDDSGNPVAVRRDYKTLDVLKPELLVAGVRAKGQQKIAFEIDCSFPNQIVEASPATSIYMQVVGKDVATGLAELMFQQHAGYVIETANRYYGYNWMNLAAALTKEKAEGTLVAGTNELMGNGMFISSISATKAKIENNRLTITDDGTNLPVFCVGQIADRIDTMELHLKNMLAKVSIQDKEDAFIYSLMKWTKDTPATLPILTGYQNAQPEFADGWVKVADKFISEDTVSGIHEDTNAFTVPADAKQFAMIIYPAASQTPTTLTLADFEVDVSPAFTKPIISTTFPATEYHLERNLYAYRALTQTPNGYVSLRYTVNAAETKLPFGIVSGGDTRLVNDRSWNTAGNKWPFEGDGKFLDDGKVTVSYTAQVYCGESVPDGGSSSCSIWLSRVNGDGSFTEVPNSRMAFVCLKSFGGAKTIQSPKFSFQVKANDTYRMFAQSDIDDGCYLKSGTNGVPLLRLDIDYSELQEIDQSVIDQITQNNEVRFMDGDKEVHGKILEYDIGAGKLKVVDK